MCIQTLFLSRHSFKSLYSFKFLPQTSVQLSWKAEDICTYLYYRYIVHISEPRQEKEGQRDQRMDGTMDGKRKVRWRLHGYLQTENMEEKPRVLASWRPPWKKTKGMGKNRKTIVNDRERGRDRRNIQIIIEKKKECWDLYVVWVFLFSYKISLHKHHYFPVHTSLAEDMATRRDNIRLEQDKLILAYM